MKRAILFIFLVFLADIIPFIYGVGFIRRFYYYDMILHFSGGFFVAMFFYHFLTENLLKEPQKSLIKAEFFIFILLISSATLFVGVFWEFLEYLTTIYFGDYLAENYQIICCIGNLDDTLGDLGFDLAGAIIFTLLNKTIHINNNIKVPKG